MCAPSGGWRKHAELYNPANIPVVLREYQNEVSPSKLDVRGGYKASDHIDILGNWEMTVSINRVTPFFYKIFISFSFLIAGSFTNCIWKGIQCFRKNCFFY